ncbi:transporter, drug/metabolite exporter family [Luminiphilus syltensis NOR5-1B]|uniref:Transporter, drug/metabolite exporter family n=1 Tax=Luminiphilus syltensis NOR5-1B TaxID=565045 RepID=B8KWP1_9GAMM|nr:DMT family transporter [Luminiphilus syltensis]EED35269.1 transporter, drug/metabolite exporter family [Luminiphilus syltensis NOR5-1B]
MVTLGPKSQQRAIGYGVMAVLMWSTVATAFKLSLEYLSPAPLLLIATAASWLFLLFYVITTGRWSAIRQRPLNNSLRGLTLGLINPALYYLLLFSAYDRLPAQQAMAINYTWALTLGLIAIPVLGQSWQTKAVLAALLSYAGVLVIATDGDLLNLHLTEPVGTALALLSTLLWAGYWLIGARDTQEPVSALLLNFTGALPPMLLWVVSDPPASWPLPGIIGGLYIGLIEMGLSFVCWLTAMRLAQNTLQVSSLIFLSPPLSLLFIWALLDEPILAPTLIGLGFILAGLLIQQRR